MRTLALACCIAAASAAAGCMSVHLTPPSGYVVVDYPYPYDIKTISATGHVLAARVHENTRPPGDLDYWSSAVEHQKVQLDGMTLAAREAIRSDAGVDGTLFEFELGEGQGKTAYWVAVFVKDRRIVTVEAAGPADALQEEAEPLSKAIRSVR